MQMRRDLVGLEVLSRLGRSQAKVDHERTDSPQRGLRHDLCELVRLNDLERLYALKRALPERHIDGYVLGDLLGPWGRPADGQEPRLVIHCRDLVYARWVAKAVGIDAWPDEGEPDEAGSRVRDREAA